MIADLMMDIGTMQNVVAYYETRIMRKRIAIEEIMHGRDCRVTMVESNPPPPMVGSVLKPPVVSNGDRPPRGGLRPMPPRAGKSVREMVVEILPELNEPFWYFNVKRKVLEKNPDRGMRERIKKGTGQACRQLLATGELVKTQGGLKRGKPPVLHDS